MFLSIFFVTVPSLVATQEHISVLSGRNVTLGCNPSDSSLALQWRIYRTAFYPEVIDIPSEVDDEVTDNSFRTRLQYQSPLIHQLTLINTTLEDQWPFVCQIKSPRNELSIITQQISLNVFPSKFTYLLIWLNYFLLCFQMRLILAIPPMY